MTRKLSTGQPSTLGTYRQLSLVFFGQESAVIKFLDDKIAKEKDGAEAEVVADEGQMIYLLSTIHAKEKP